MCTKVEVNGKICSSQGDLANALGGPLVMDYGQQDDGVCLCPVHLRLTAERYGYSVGEWDGYTVKLEKAQPHAG